MKNFLICILSLLLFTTLQGQDGFIGNWKGKIEIPGGKLDVLFHLDQQGGAWTCDMDVPMQGAKGIAAATVQIKEEIISLSYPNLAANYEGKLDSKDAIAGTWTQGGQAFTLNLERFTGETALDRPQHPKAPFPYDIEEIAVEIGEQESAYALAGTLTSPKGEGPFPTAILVTGSGPQDRDETIFEHKPFWVIADYFARNGIATFRYDDRGVASSTGDASTATTYDFTQDALAVLTKIRAHKKVNSEKIGIVGHSEGGLIAAMAAAESKAVKYTIMLAGPAVSGVNLAKRQSADMARADGATEEEIERDGLFAGEMIDLAMLDIPKAEKIEKAKARLKIFFENQHTPKEQEALPPIDTYIESSVNALFNPWMSYFLKLNPQKYLERIVCPTLALFGEKDIQVAADMNVAAMKVALENAPCEIWEVEEMKNLNHLFQRSRTGALSEYATNIETFNPQVLIKMRDWIKSI